MSRAAGPEGIFGGSAVCGGSKGSSKHEIKKEELGGKKKSDISRRKAAIKKNRENSNQRTLKDFSGKEVCVESEDEVR